MRIVAFAVLLLSHAASASAQNPIGYGIPLVQGRFGVFLMESYAGTLEWTHTSGDSHYSASATLRDGHVHCTATSRSPEGTFSASGPGLIDISLGLPPDEDNPPARPGGKLYIIRAACPNPRSPPPHVAAWSDEYSTYKQQGGDYNSEHTASGTILVHKLPEQLKGHWEATSEEETRTMTWNLCLRGMACPGNQ